MPSLEAFAGVARAPFLLLPPTLIAAGAAAAAWNGSFSWLETLLALVGLVAVLPSLLLVQPLKWIFGETSEPVPVPALGANVIWNLATNAFLAVGFVVDLALRS